MDPMYYHGFWGFHVMGLLFAFFIGTFVGRRMAWRRMWMMQAGGAGGCMPYRGGCHRGVRPPAAGDASAAGTAPGSVNPPEGSASK